MNSNLLRSVIYVASIFGLYLATAMFLPALTDLYYGNDDWMVFALSGFMCGGFALACALATRGPIASFNTERLTRPETVAFKMLDGIR